MAHALVVETARAMPANPWTTYTQRAMPASEPPMPTRSESPESAPKKVELPAVEPEPEPEVHATTQADTPTTQEGPEDEDREVPAGGLIQFQTSFRLSDRLIQNQDVPMDEALSVPTEIPRLPEETVDESLDIGTHRLPDLDDALPEEAVDDTLEMLVSVSGGGRAPKEAPPRHPRWQLGLERSGGPWRRKASRVQGVTLSFSQRKSVDTTDTTIPPGRDPFGPDPPYLLSYLLSAFGLPIFSQLFFP